MRLNWQNNLDAHVLSLMHQLSINDDLVSANLVADCISRVSGRRDLDLSPLTVGRHKLALSCTLLELLVNTLLFDAAFPLDQR